MGNCHLTLHFVREVCFGHDHDIIHMGEQETLSAPFPSQHEDTWVGGVLLESKHFFLVMQSFGTGGQSDDTFQDFDQLPRLQSRNASVWLPEILWGWKAHWGRPSGCLQLPLSTSFSMPLGVSWHSRASVDIFMRPKSHYPAVHSLGFAWDPLLGQTCVSHGSGFCRGSGSLRSPPLDSSSERARTTWKSTCLRPTKRCFSLCGMVCNSFFKLFLSATSYMSLRGVVLVLGIRIPHLFYFLRVKWSLFSCYIIFFILFAVIFPNA